MDYAFIVRRRQPGARLLDNLESLGWWEFAFIREKVAEIMTLDVLHGNKFKAARFSDIKDPNDVFMRNLASQEQFLGEAVNYLRLAGKVRANALERNDSINITIMGFIDSAHAAHTEDILDLKASPKHLSGLQDRFQI
jgi:hypothetical protein